MKSVRWAVLGAIVALWGCAGRVEHVQDVVTVEKRVKEPCIEREPVRPTYSFGKGEWPEGKDAAVVLADDFEKAERYGQEWEAAAAGCLVVPAAKP